MQNMSILFLAILNRKKNFYTVKKILACYRRHKTRKPSLQMTSFRLSYLAIAIDNLYTYEQLGYMRCLFLKLSLNHSFFSVFFFVLFLFGWFLLYRNTCVVSIVYKTIYGCIILIMTLKLCEKSFENFSSLILKL